MITVGIDYGRKSHSAVSFMRRDEDGVAVILDTLSWEPAEIFIALLRLARASRSLDHSLDRERRPLIRSSVDFRNFVAALNEVPDNLFDALVI